MVPFLETFDYANTAESVGTRPVTTVAPQALLLLNSEFANEDAAALAARVRAMRGRIRTGKSIDSFVWPCAARFAHRIHRGEPTLGRPPQKGADPLQSLCLVVLNLNEFIYVD